MVQEKIEKLNCKYKSTCSGCMWIEKDYSEQIQLKKEHIFEQLSNNSVSFGFNDLEYIYINNKELRDRVDFTLKIEEEKLVFGLYSRDKSRIVDIDECPMMSKELAEFYTEFKKDLPPTELASIRLRVAPDGKKGIWLDMPNIAIKELLTEDKWLRKWLKIAKIEIGQRRKVLKIKDSNLKLLDPEFYPWFETYVGEELKPASIQCSIGGFTQTGFKANKKLVEQVMKLVAPIEAKNILELCSGVGNFTAALASVQKNVTAIEIDRMANDANLASLNKLGLSKNVEVVSLSIHRPSDKLYSYLSSKDMIVVDPPRSGLKGFLDTMEKYDSENLAPYFLYISCFAESMATDISRLYKMGYKLKKLKLVDQFPQSPHCEYIGLLVKM